MKPLLFALATIIALSGCSVLEFAQERPTIALAAVSSGTIRYIDGDTAKAQRVESRAASIREYASGRTVSVRQLEAQLRREIDLDRYPYEDQVVIDALITELRRELEYRIGTGELTGGEMVRVDRVMERIEMAARHAQ